MKKGTIPVYSGRGMVIGCAEAGKTTLVKKLKEERNITTTSTKGIKIHVHEFKLDAEECTIISKKWESLIVLKLLLPEHYCYCI